MVELYGSVGIVAGLGQVVYLAAAFVLAWHLLARARRSRDLAPLLLGIQLLFAMGFGYLLCAAGMGLAMLSTTRSPGLVSILLAAGHGATIIGLSAALLFERRVFWPEARWPLAPMAGMIAAMEIRQAGRDHERRVRDGQLRERLGPAPHRRHARHESLGWDRAARLPPEAREAHG